MTQNSFAAETSVIRHKLSLNDFRTRLLSKSSFVILDACDEPVVPPKVRELGISAASLYRGSAEQDFFAIAPYLAQLDETLLDWIISNLWNNPWGIFVNASCDLDELRKHFRRFLKIELSNKQKAYFRFYDPRVLSIYLKNCLASETSSFFGPTNFFAIQLSPNELEIIRPRKDEQ